MAYYSQTTCRIVRKDRGPNDPDFSALRVHEAVLGLPLCNLPVRPWHGHETVLYDNGPGEVTCLRCARIASVRAKDG